MNRKALSIMMVVVVAFSLLGTANPASAVGYGTSFATSITYMNIGDGEARILVDFYAEGGTTIEETYPVANLPSGAAASMGVGSVFPSTFKGSAVMSSSQPLLATMVQVPQGTTTVKNRPLSNGFSDGSTLVLIPTVLKGGTNSVFSIQNTGGDSATVDVEFIPATPTSGTAHTDEITIAPGASKYYDMGVYNAGGSTFSGSVRISSGQTMVATVMEQSTSSDAVYAFEGASETGTTLYMPSAMCRLGGATTSYFAIQNASETGTGTTISIDFSGVVGTTPYSNTIDYGTLDAGQKLSAAGCGTPSDPIPSTFIGSAVVNSTSQPVVGIAKIVGSGAYVAAHSGATSGSEKLAAPYVRYTNKFYSYRSTSQVQRTYIAVQNVGGSTLPAGSITVKFVGPDGVSQGTYTYDSELPVGAKFSVSPATVGLYEFGYVPDATTGRPKSFGGGALIEGPGGSELAAVIRIATNTSAGDVAEDYNAMSAIVTD